MTTTTMFALAMVGILLPFVTAFIIIITPRPAARWLCVIAAAIATLATLGVWLAFSQAGSDSVNVDLISWGGLVLMGFTFDKLTVMLSTCFVFIGFLITMYSFGYMSQRNREHPDKPRRRFYAFFIIFIGAMAGLVYSSTVIGFLVFFEITGACSWALIGYYATDKARHAAMKALIVTHIAALGLYLAIGVLYVQTGSFEISAIANLDMFWKGFVLICITVAAWGKSAQLPFYMWLPSAMEAPTPVSAYLHGASMVKIGVVIMARSLTAAGAIPDAVGWVLVIGAIATLIFSFLMYLPQRDMKRLLAFSTISQLSYMFLGFAFYVFGSQLAFTGSVMHIFNHAFAKTLFFLIAGAFSCCVGTRLLPKLKGVLKKLPILGVGFAVAALAIAGVPPFNGFFSKTTIFVGAFSVAGGNWLLMLIVIVALIETVCAFAWFLKWIGSVLPGEPSEEVAAAEPVPKVMVVVFVVLIIMTICSSFIAGAWLG
ncbi:MAG: hydrogenase 4 subunit D [Coriobacteriales bacterium]|nr:hydrogenase 4 subunit D [Coriobacteriales bacterium]